MSRLVIASIGPASSVQDGGRHGAQRYGLTVSGAMDRLSLAAANTLVGNAPFAAVVEIGPFGGHVHCQRRRRARRDIRRAAQCGRRR
ncbi:allophanate hydrolase subunit 2 [Bradyrhizobium sp. S3.7.6]